MISKLLLVTAVLAAVAFTNAADATSPDPSLDHTELSAQLSGEDLLAQLSGEDLLNLDLETKAEPDLDLEDEIGEADEWGVFKKKKSGKKYKKVIGKKVVCSYATYKAKGCSYATYLKQKKGVELDLEDEIAEADEWGVFKKKKKTASPPVKLTPAAYAKAYANGGRKGRRLLEADATSPDPSLDTSELSAQLSGEDLLRDLDLETKAEPQVDLDLEDEIGEADEWGVFKKKKKKKGSVVKYKWVKGKRYVVCSYARRDAK